MYCENCGKKIVKGSEFCTECGKKIENNLNKKNNNTNKNNGLRIASIVLGVLGIVCSITILFSVFGFIMSLVGLILGICALKNGKNVLGIILNVIGMILFVIVCILMFFGVRYFLDLNIDAYLPDMIVENNYDFSSIDLNVLYENDVPMENVLNKIDEVILEEKYPEDDDMIDEVEDTAEYYYNMYEQYYGYTKEEFLSNYSFLSEDDFIDSLKLDYRRNKYYEGYVEGLVTEEEINKYYKDEVFGDVDSKHILVMVSEDGLSDEDAKMIANEIINKLDSGKTWDDVIKEYKDKIIAEELGYMAFNASLESAYLKECKDLKVGEYSKIPVLTSYGYHIVYKIDQKNKPSLKDVKDEIIKVIANEKISNDDKLYYKSLISMRKESGFSFEGTVYEDLYNQYIEEYK